MPIEQEDHHYNKGKADRVAWDSSKMYSSFDRELPAKEVMKLFMPPVDNDLMQISRPMPKNHQDWIKGFVGDYVAINPTTGK